MNINLNEIKQYLKNFNPEHFTEDDVDYFISEISLKDSTPDFNWETGATKCVLIPDNRDYVIKIPFDGEMDYFEDCKFRYFYNGAGWEGWDYCSLEQEYYIELIKGSEFEEFFLCPESIDAHRDWPIYVQPKITPCAEAEGRHYKSIDSLYTVREEGISSKIRDIPDIWLATCLENMNNDVDKLNRFTDFLKENFNDLHTGNIGYLGDRAVIIDFAGFDH